jgi:hypothetical protein
MKGKVEKRPRLARASDPFTPLTHRVAPAETPYHPLRVDDLATPKVNKSQSSSDHTEINMSAGSEGVTTDESVAELRKALLSAMAALDRIEKSKKPVNYRTASTQTTEVPCKRDRAPSKENKPQHEVNPKPIASDERNRLPLISGSPISSSSSDSRDKALELVYQRQIDRMAAIRHVFEAKLDILESQ